MYEKNYTPQFRTLNCYSYFEVELNLIIYL